MEKTLVGYMAVDVINNSQAYIQGGSLEDLKKAEKSGIVFLAVYSDESKEIVKPDQIDFSLLTPMHEINIVQQEVFVPLMNALAEVIETSYSPAVALIAGTQKRAIDGKLENFKNLLKDMNERYLPNIEGETDGNNS